MKLSHLLSLSTAVAGGAAAWRTLTRRQQWEASNKRIAICVDFDDVETAAIRAGLPLAALLHRLSHNGATHITLPELTIHRLLAAGQLTPQAPTQPLVAKAAVGHWNYLHGNPDLLTHLAAELHARLPYTQAQCLDSHTLAFAGNLPSIGPIGLGFDATLAQLIRDNDLAVAPQPINYDWPEKALIERTLTQAAQFSNLIIFGGNMVLGHEMQLTDTIATMTDKQLAMAFFAETRHQRGDWFIAKGRVPDVVMAHRFSTEEMHGMDYHAACHAWVHFANERGVRLCYVNFFRVLHAVEPLEGVAYVHHLKHALEDAGYTVTTDLLPPMPQPAADTQELALAGVAAAGMAATAVSRTLNLPEPLAVPFVLLSAASGAALPYLEAQRADKAAHSHHDHHDHDHDHDNHDHNHHSHDHDHGHSHVAYPASYTPKLLSLAATAFAPIAAANRDDWLGGLMQQAAAAAILAAVTTGPEYHLRVEAYKGFQLDWLLPLMGAAWQIPHKPARLAAMGALLAGWTAVRNRPNLLDQIDAAPAVGHTHHISAATRVIGDTAILLGPRPARKWAGLGPAAGGLSVALAQQGYGNGAAAAGLVAAAGHALGLVGFHHAERAIEKTVRESLPSFAVGTAVGLLLLLLGRNQADG